MDRLTLVLVFLAGVLVSCAPGDKERYHSWDADFANCPTEVSRAVTALWISNYQEDPETHRFARTVAWGEVPEKLVPDGRGGFSVVVNLVVQEENSDGPKPDRFWPLLVQVVEAGGTFSLVPNEALPGTVVVWQDRENRTVRFRGLVKGPGSSKILWQFQGRY